MESERREIHVKSNFTNNCKSRIQDSEAFWKFSIFFCCISAKRAENFAEKDGCKKITALDVIGEKNMVREKVKKIVGTFCVVGVLMVIPVSVYADTEDEQPAIFKYGTQIVGINKKEVYSDYLHEEAVHRSSVTIGNQYESSGWVPKAIWSHASAVGAWKDTTHAYYDYDYDR